jgi:3-hydroxyisobutyrate dehydrogenase-like beta-hydroxyacid dehydrogenase
VPDIGFVGLGTMGAPMARRLLDAGARVTVYDRRAGAAEQMAALGAHVAQSSETLAAASEVILVTVVNDGQVREVLGDGGALGLLGHARPGAVVVIHSTVHPDTCRELAAVGARRQVTVIDAPMTGSPNAAAAGSLSFMAGGDASTIDRIRPVLAPMATRVTRVGDVGAGQVAKLANNLAIAVTLCAVHEALTLAEAFGIDSDVMLPLLSSGGAASWVAGNWRDIGLTADAYPGGSAGLAGLTNKDVALALELAGRRDLAMPAADTASRLLDEAYAAAQTDAHQHRHQRVPLSPAVGS